MDDLEREGEREIYERRIKKFFLKKTKNKTRKIVIYHSYKLPSKTMILSLSNAVTL